MKTRSGPCWRPASSTRTPLSAPSPNATPGFRPRRSPSTRSWPAVCRNYFPHSSWLRSQPCVTRTLPIITRPPAPAARPWPLLSTGPLGPALGINAGNNLFGPGHRANATIGRALRLVMMNVLNTRPGLLDRATLGNPGKYSLCFAEDEANTPWQPLHVERGFQPHDSTVTLYASNSLCGVYNQLASSPEPLLLEFADAVCNLATPNVYGFKPDPAGLGRRAHRGAGRQRLEQTPGPGVRDSTRAAHGGRFQTRGAPARRDYARRRNHLALRHAPSRRPAPRVCGRPGRQLVGLPAGRGAIGGPRVLPSRLHEPQEERHAAHSL